MINFKTLEMKNFLSYGNSVTTVRLDRPGTTLIVGEDLDNTANGQGANGVGKTVMINALAYGMYDKPISAISKDNLVNNLNKKNMEVSVSFEINGNDYKITRYRKTKAGAAGNGAKLIQYLSSPDNNPDVEWKDITPDSIGNTNKLIESIVGIPYELFCRIVVFSATHIPFLDLKVRHPTEPNQTDIIEELFDLKALSEKAELLKAQIKSTEQNQDVLMTKVESLKREHSRHETQVENATARVDGWVVSNDEEILRIQGKLKLLEDVDVELQKKLHDEVDATNKELNSWLEKQRETERHIKDVVKGSKKLTNELSHLEDEKCPYCLQDFESAKEKITEITNKLKDTDGKVEQYGAELEEIDQHVSTFTEQLKEAESKIVISDLDELLNIKSKSEQYANKVKELQQATNPFEEPLQELNELELEPIGMGEINTISETIEHQKFLLKLLTKKDSFVRKVLLNKYIPFLNTRLLTYLTDLGLPHTVEFTHEMTANITQFGREMDFGNLSNGQRSRVNLAISLAFRDVLQSLHQKINVCMLDEVLDVGLDAVGVQNAARMLKRKARDENLSLYIISHRDEIDSAFDQTMTIQMSKGFSHVKEE
jgi:DNA repair exonuclease SbcCD ATPase subunit